MPIYTQQENKVLLYFKVTKGMYLLSQIVNNFGNKESDANIYSARKESIHLMFSANLPAPLESLVIVRTVLNT